MSLKSSSLSSLLARRWSWIEFTKERLQESISICTSVSIKLQTYPKLQVVFKPTPSNQRERAPQDWLAFLNPFKVTSIIITTTTTTLLYNLHHLLVHHHHSHTMVEGSLWIETFLNRSVCFINPQIFITAATKASCIHLFRAKPSLITTHKPSGLISPCLHISSCAQIAQKPTHKLLLILQTRHRTILHFIWEYNPHHHHLICTPYCRLLSFRFKNTSPVFTSSYEAPDTAFLCQDTSEEEGTPATT